MRRSLRLNMTPFIRKVTREKMARSRPTSKSSARHVSTQFVQSSYAIASPTHSHHVRCRMEDDFSYIHPQSLLSIYWWTLTFRTFSSLFRDASLTSNLFSSGLRQHLQRTVFAHCYISFYSIIMHTIVSVACLRHTVTLTIVDSFRLYNAVIFWSSMKFYFTISDNIYWTEIFQSLFYTASLTFC